MGGGGSNSSPPVDVAPGGGTYPVDSSGNAYNPEWGSSQGTSQLGAALGKGFQQFGNAVTQSESHTNYETGSPNYPQQNNTGLNVGFRPQEIALDQRVFDNKRQQELAQALQRLMSEQNVIKPDTGAAKYWYVDPRAQQYDPMADTRSNQGQLEQWGAQPGF